MEKHYRTHVKWKQIPGFGQEPHILLSGALRWKFAELERPALIAVGGPGGIGKTTFAGKLAAELKEAVILGLDDYKSPRDTREQKKIYGPHPEANDMKLLHSHLRQLRQGKTIEKPRYCRDRGKIDSTISFEPDTFVIVEGEIATYKEFYSEIDFSIFIDSHWETQLNTRIKRDIQ
ncbi:MAG: uridine kinase family protein, partial [Verrucomicrobiota bacterium]